MSLSEVKSVPIGAELARLYEGAGLVRIVSMRAWAV
jgi:hypothetical protein